MLLVLYKSVDDKNMVSSIINLNVADVPQDVKDSGVIVESIPDPEAQPGKTAVAYVDVTNKAVYYEYVGRPLMPEERIAQLEQQLKITQDALDALLLA
ncbi:hypothetical protein NST23_24590 [Brevibacillus sp. FSL K6-0770]|uniref:hypothetical protein n=1 Tax=Brevibacillus sp. FSL K6-0770 TaxID=2954673 RepID=UPI0030F797F1